VAEEMLLSHGLSMLAVNEKVTTNNHISEEQAFTFFLLFGRCNLLVALGGPVLLPVSGERQLVALTATRAQVFTALSLIENNCLVKSSLTAIRLDIEKLNACI